MPYQSLASLGVIIAMFNVVPLLNTGVQALAYGVRIVGSVRWIQLNWIRLD